MADGSSVEITIGTGDKPEKPGASLSGTVEIGGSEVDDLKSTFAGILGNDPEDLTAYVVVKCNNGDAASALSDKLSNLWQAATNEPPMGPLGMAAHQLKGETDESSIAIVSFKAEGDNCIIQINMGSDRFEQVNGMIQMGEMQAATITENNQQIKFDLTHDRTVEEILTSEASLTLSIPNGLRVAFNLKLWSQLAQACGGIAEGFGIPPQIQAAIAMAGLYKGLDLKVQLRAPDVLPKTLRDRIFPSESNEIPMVRGMFEAACPPQEKEIIEAFTEHGNGGLSVYLKASKIVAHVEVNLPGLSKAFKE